MISTLSVGQSVAVTHAFTAQEVDVFEEISGLGSAQPLSAIGATQVPSMLISARLSALLATHLPGPGTDVSGLFLKVYNQALAGDVITMHVRVAAITESSGVIRMAVKAFTSRHVCVEGEAVVTFHRTQIGTG